MAQPCGGQLSSSGVELSASTIQGTQCDSRGPVLESLTSGPSAKVKEEDSIEGGDVRLLSCCKQLEGLHEESMLFRKLQVSVSEWD